MTAFQEIKSGNRFEFGANWRHFLNTLNDERIQYAEEDVRRMLQCRDLHGRTFLDVGCGSGLSSLAARRLGAKVFSFDYDEDCVQCARMLKQRFHPRDPDWEIQTGNVLDEVYMMSLGKFDFVYSWGVLHHTGKMWEAMKNICHPLAPDGRVFIAIYNDQGRRSDFWRLVKRTYCKSPAPFKPCFVLFVGGVREAKALVGACLRGEPFSFFQKRWNYQQKRGMSRWHDLVDWIGGYPFEVAKPEEIFEFFKERKFVLQKLVTAGGGVACNRFVFQKADRIQIAA